MIFWDYLIVSPVYLIYILKSEMWPVSAADTWTALALLSFPLGIWSFVKNGKSTAYKSFIMLLAGIILANLITHLLSVYTIWVPDERLEGITELISILLSLILAVLFFGWFSRLLALPGQEQVQNLNEELDRQIREKQKAETRLTAITENLAKNSKDLDEFAYIVSHDLKAPLRAISSLSQWIDDDTKNILPPETQKNMELLLNKVHRMEDLITGILEYSRIGRIKSSFKKVDLAGMLHDITDMLLPPAGFHIHIPGDLPVFTTDPVKLNQVFLNLMSNAIKHHHSPSTGRIDLSCQEYPHHFLFTVKDNGPGIADSEKERIFLIFQTLNPQKSDKGVGLAIVKKIVEEMGGKTWVESVSNKGSEFKFTWPKEHIKQYQNGNGQND